MKVCKECVSCVNVFIQVLYLALWLTSDKTVNGECIDNGYIIPFLVLQLVGL